MKHLVKSFYINDVLIPSSAEPSFLHPEAVVLGGEGAGIARYEHSIN